MPPQPPLHLLLLVLLLLGTCQLILADADGGVGAGGGIGVGGGVGSVGVGGRVPPGMRDLPFVPEDFRRPTAANGIVVGGDGGDLVDFTNDTQQVSRLSGRVVQALTRYAANLSQVQELGGV